MENQPRLARLGSARQSPTPFHYIYHHIQTCSVRSSAAEGADTLPLFTLPLYVLCVHTTIFCKMDQISISILMWWETHTEQ